MRILANHEFYNELEQTIIDLVDNGIVSEENMTNIRLHLLNGLEGRLQLVNNYIMPLGYRYEAVYTMSNGQVKFYKTDEFLL